MSWQQVLLLRGASRTRQVLVWALLGSIALLILHLWSPGTTASIFSVIFKVITHISVYVGDIINSLRELVHDISGWYR